MTAYYNEFDPYAAQWLRNLIAAGVIAPGDVDERSIEDVTPNDLRGYTQCHFFAGIGGWAYALDLAGWPRDRPVWTGSCPCQPFSAAGKGAGFEDERHLWPAWQHLINQCRPPVIFGEQVASKAVDAWIDLVHTDMEGMGYAFGSVPFPAAGVGAPHIRDRNYWVADAEGHGHERAGQLSEQAGRDGASHLCADGWLAYAEVVRREGQHLRAGRGLPQVGIANIGGACGVADTNSDGCESRDGIRLHGEKHDVEHGGSAGIERPGPTNGFWRDADWLGCRDGKWRPVEPSVLGVVDGLPGDMVRSSSVVSASYPLAQKQERRVMRLKGYGNAIVPPQAAQFIIASMEIINAVHGRGTEASEAA